LLEVVAKNLVDEYLWQCQTGTAPSMHFKIFNSAQCEKEKKQKKK